MIFKRSVRFQKYIVPVIVAILLATLFPFSPPKAEAVTFFTIELPAGSEAVKDYVLDPLVNAIGVALIRTMSDNIKSWIRNGFNGKPLFVTDWEGYLRKAGNEAFGIFVDGLIANGAPNICSPFRIDIVLGLVSAQRQQAVCTLDRFIANVDALYNTFETYGWTGFISITTANVANNAFGSILIQMDQTQRAILEKVTGLKLESQASGGFLSWKRCAEYSKEIAFSEAAGTDKPCLREETVTPGSYVAKKLELPDEYTAIKTAVSDEINELISTVVVQLLNSALSGTGRDGILSSGGSSNPDYSGLLNNSRKGITPLLTDAINLTNGYIKAKERSSNTLTQTIQTLNKLHSCGTQPRNEEIAEAQKNLDDIKSELKSARAALSDYENSRVKAETTNSPQELSDVGTQAVDSANQSASQDDIDAANQQADEFQEKLDSLLSELQACPGS
ncbi:MAG: hypothetical protein HYY55_03080 [Candidatus Niyogibacteria bacterium]|nr:MAG: hypothetical protein HYY55_03080 [Candidatus Niyogibacteria bacterium]